MTRTRTWRLLATVVAVAAAGGLVAAPARAQAQVVPAPGPEAGGWAVPAVPDPLPAGRYPVTHATYDFGDDAVPIPGFPIKAELRGVVHYPVRPRGHRFPLVLFLHGRHATCGFGQDISLDWPCPKPLRPIPSYRGYDYLARHLASHGYVVVSISANAISARDNEVQDFGMAARAWLVERHLELWLRWGTTGGRPFGRRFVDAIDFSRVGLMGHSRGGEGVVTHAAGHAGRVLPYTIRAVLPLAPTDFTRRTVTRVPLGIVLPYCDGDVSDLQGVHFYDDSRYALRGDPAAKHTVTVFGANHNFFNAVWSPSSGQPGAFDDADWQNPGSVCGPKQPTRLSEARQRAVAIAYVNSFFRYYLGRERTFGPLWTGAARTPGSVPARVLVTYHAPDVPGARQEVNRLADPDDLHVDALGGPVTLRGLTGPRICRNRVNRPACLSATRQVPSQSEPHADDVFLGTSGTPLFKAQWSRRGARLVNELPHGDLAPYQAVQFRAALDFSDRRNPLGVAQNLRIVLVDGLGRSTGVAVAPYTHALDFPPMARVEHDLAPHFLLNQVRVPLRAFRGADLADVRAVTLVFDRTPSGSLGISDLLVTS